MTPEKLIEMEQDLVKAIHTELRERFDNHFGPYEANDIAKLQITVDYLIWQIAGLKLSIKMLGKDLEKE